MGSLDIGKIERLSWAMIYDTDDKQAVAETFGVGEKSVQAVIPTAFTVDPSAQSGIELTVGNQDQLTAIDASSAQGESETVDDIQWYSSDPSVLSVGVDGLARALSEGQAYVWVVYGGTLVSDRVLVEVSPAVTSTSSTRSTSQVDPSGQVASTAPTQSGTGSATARATSTPVIMPHPHGPGPHSTHPRANLRHKPYTSGAQVFQRGNERVKVVRPHSR